MSSLPAAIKVTTAAPIATLWTSTIQPPGIGPLQHFLKLVRTLHPLQQRGKYSLREDFQTQTITAAMLLTYTTHQLARGPLLLYRRGAELSPQLLPATRSFLQEEVAATLRRVMWSTSLIHLPARGPLHTCHRHVRGFQRHPQAERSILQVETPTEQSAAWLTSTIQPPASGLRQH